MKTYLRTIIKLLVFMLIALWMSAGLRAAGDILVSFRFYEGQKEDDTTKAEVVTSYYLKPLFVGNIVSAVGVDREKEELKRIFNLSGLKLMTRTQWGWKQGVKDNRFQVVILNGHEFVVKLSLLEMQDGFKVGVVEKNKSGEKHLLDTTITLPEQKTAVFGFEDSMNKPYFLSFHREKDESVILDEPLPLSDEERPKLIRRISPAYPVVALKSRLQGKVIMDVTTDYAGRVIMLKIVHGHPLLRAAAIKAVRQWQYEPYIVKGKAVAVNFTVTVAFFLKDTGKTKKDAGKPKGQSRSIPDIWPTRGYLTSTFGFRIHPITGKRTFHNGVDIAAEKGTKVTAAADGQVITAEFREVYGNLVIIDHKNGYTTRYGRLQSFTVKKGDRIKKGEVIGFVGNTGQSTAPHLHWEVRSEGKPINPLSLIED